MQVDAWMKVNGPSDPRDHEYRFDYTTSRRMFLREGATTLEETPPRFAFLRIDDEQYFVVAHDLTLDRVLAIPVIMLSPVETHPLRNEFVVEWQEVLYDG